LITLRFALEVISSRTIAPMFVDRRTALPVIIVALLTLVGSIVGAPSSWAVVTQSSSASPLAIPASRQADRVAVVPITGAIDDVTLWSLERRLRAAREQGYDAVVIELDTPGGEVTATIDICLRMRTEAPENTVAWIHPKAFSAGTFIALACREIVVAPSSTFGDAAPIAVLPGLGLSPLPAAERAKMESPLLDELDASAARRGDDPRLLHAFVVTERELWVIERNADGVRRFADRAEVEALGLDPAKSAVRPPTTLTIASRPLSAAELPLDAKDRGTWTLVELVDDATRLLVVQPDEALRWGLATGVVANDTELAQYFGAKSVTRFPESFWESAVRFLVSWPIRILLIAVLVVSLVIEGLHPGIGVAGGIASAALLLLIGAPSLLGLAEWWEILLVLAGIALIAIEVFVTPGIGFVGLAGALCILLGLVASFTGSDPTSASERSALLTATTTTVAGLVAGGLLTWFASRWFRETSLFRGAVLSASIGRAHEQPIRGEAPIPQIGTIGIADSDLRPSGRVRFGRDLIDAQSTGDYLARGSTVIVVARVGVTVIVEVHSNEKGQA
jgi:membrane-bound serine protease (ClpP class)